MSVFSKLKSLLTICILFLSFSCRAGWLITEKKEDKFGNFSSQSLIIEGQRVRIEHSTSTFIFDLEKKIVTLVFPGQLVSWSGSADSLKHHFLRSVEQQIMVMVEQMPEAERERNRAELNGMIEEMRLGEQDTSLLSRFSIISTDSVAELLGHPTRKYLLKIDSLTIEQLWVTHAVQPYQTVSLTQLNAMMRLFSRPTLLSTARSTEAWMNLIAGGVVMRSVLDTPLGPNVMEVIQLRETAIREDFFLPPEHYRKIGIAEVINIMMGESGIAVTPSAEDEEWRPLLPVPKPGTPRKEPPKTTFPDEQMD